LQLNIRICEREPCPEARDNWALIERQELGTRD